VYIVYKRKERIEVSVSHPSSLEQIKYVFFFCSLLYYGINVVVVEVVVEVVEVVVVVVVIVAPLSSVGVPK